MSVFFSAFAAFMLLGIPIAIALGMGCMVLLWATGQFHMMSAFPRYMAAGLDQFLLLSIPLFVLTGNLMSRGGITERIVLLAQALVGRLPGGLSMVGVTTCMFFGSAATATSEAAVMNPAMNRRGYPRDCAAALIAVSSVMGSVIPPAISMIIFGALTGTSIASLFLAGIAPGIMIGLFLMIYAWRQAVRHGYPVAPRMTWRARVIAVTAAAPAALLPVIILGGILSGTFTPTESAGVAVIYALILSAGVYRQLTWQGLYEALWQTAFLTAGIMIVVAMALLGAGCAPVLMASIFIFAHSYPPARLAVMTSWMIAFGSAGNVAGTSPLATAADFFGWRHVMLVLAAVSFVTGFALIAFVRDPEIEKNPRANVGFAGFIEALRIRKLWPIIPLVGLNYAPSVGILGLWAGPYLADIYGADSLLIGHVTLFMAIAVVTGSFVYGPLDTIFGTRKWVAVAGNTGSVLVVAYLALFPESGITRVTVSMVLIGLFGASYALIMAHARAYLPPHLTGRGMALLNFFSMGTVGVMQFLTGAVATAATVPGKPVVAYSALFGFYALTLGIAVIIYLFSQDARPEGIEKRSGRPR